MTSFEQQLELAPLETEIITLKAALDMINGMVNREAMTFNFRDLESDVHFKTMTHKAYFNILLVDFLSVPKEFFIKEKNYLERLQEICESPGLQNKSIHDLKVSVTEFIDWLSQTVIVEKRWFPSIDLEIDLKIKRQDFITMCGNINKHNLTKLTRQAGKLLKIMESNSQLIQIDQCLIALEDFYEQFYHDIFEYHSSTIAEFLNNIRWGIYIYACAERERCVEKQYDNVMQLQKYKYNYPTQVTSNLGKIYYWNLMNDVMNAPDIQRFEVTKYLKRRY